MRFILYDCQIVHSNLSVESSEEVPKSAAVEPAFHVFYHILQLRLIDPKISDSL